MKRDKGRYLERLQQQAREALARETAQRQAAEQAEPAVEGREDTTARPPAAPAHEQSRRSQLADVLREKQRAKQRTWR